MRRVLVSARTWEVELVWRIGCVELILDGLRTRIVAVREMPANYRF